MRKFLRLRGNKSFNYKPRYYKGEGNPYKIEHKLDKFRSTAHTNRGLKNKFSSAFEDLKNEGDKNVKIRFIVILAVLLLIFLFIIDFDLSIFFNP
ncbi:hypothetical protein MTsPCn9_01920 [Croceitalea sp. MTPC9]|uniref:riboflavin synthase subunit beta n=1 Tax=unclassified Croceitalea TaxID=2632280 RepID=UPI002B3949B5|nr:hypothetical protein MTsPCn6_06790 [Croceitalea sp. MTPC6]GMN15256.1 hypothetical protein MTsPCn9_01920 [Croceitalea sp. MTPC9]